LFFQQEVLRLLPDPRPYFAEERETWLRSFLDLPNGIPSHDTLSDVMGRIDKRVFAQAFTDWVNVALPVLQGEHVALTARPCAAVVSPAATHPTARQFT